MKNESNNHSINEKLGCQWKKKWIDERWKNEWAKKNWRTNKKNKWIYQTKIRE